VFEKEYREVSWWLLCSHILVGQKLRNYLCAFYKVLAEISATTILRFFGVLHEAKGGHMAIKLYTIRGFVIT